MIIVILWNECWFFYTELTAIVTTGLNSQCGSFQTLLVWKEKWHFTALSPWTVWATWILSSPHWEVKHSEGTTASLQHSSSSWTGKSIGFMISREVNIRWQLSPEVCTKDSSVSSSETLLKSDVQVRFDFTLLTAIIFYASKLRMHDDCERFP